MGKTKTILRSLPWLFAFVVLSGAQGHGGSISSLLLSLAVLLPSAKLGGLAEERLGKELSLGINEQSFRVQQMVGTVTEAKLHRLSYGLRDIGVSMKKMLLGFPPPLLLYL